jgi:hypothetical protein
VRLKTRKDGKALIANQGVIPTREEIELRAYELYLLRGGQDGHALDDWLAAERELAQNSVQRESTPLKARIAASSASAD